MMQAKIVEVPELRAPGRQHSFTVLPSTLPLRTDLVSTSTDCVICSAIPTNCPLACSSGSVCDWTPQTCNECPQLYCRFLTDSVSTSWSGYQLAETGSSATGTLLVQTTSTTSLAASNTAIPVDSTGKRPNTFSRERSVVLGCTLGGVLGLFGCALVAYCLLNRYWWRNNRYKGRDPAEVAAEKYAEKQTRGHYPQGFGTYDDASGKTVFDLEQQQAYGRVNSQAPVSATLDISSPRRPEVTNTIFLHRRPTVGEPRKAPKPPVQTEPYQKDPLAHGNVSMPSVPILPDLRRFSRDERGGLRFWSQYQDEAYDTPPPLADHMDLEEPTEQNLLLQPHNPEHGLSASHGSGSGVRDHRISGGARSLARNLFRRSSRPRSRSLPSSKRSSSGKFHHYKGLGKSFFSGRKSVSPDIIAQAREDHAVDAARRQFSRRYSDSSVPSEYHTKSSESEKPSIEFSLDHTTADSFVASQRPDPIQLDESGPGKNDAESSINFEVTTTERYGLDPNIHDQGPAFQPTPEVHMERVSTEYSAIFTPMQLSEFAAYAPVVSVSGGDSIEVLPTPVTIPMQLMEEEPLTAKDTSPTRDVYHHPIVSESTFIFEEDPSNGRRTGLGAPILNNPRSSSVYALSLTDAIIEAIEESSSSIPQFGSPRQSTTSALYPGSRMPLDAVASPLVTTSRTAILPSSRNHSQLSTQSASYGESSSHLSQSRTSRSSRVPSWVQPPLRPQRPEVSPFDNNYAQNMYSFTIPTSPLSPGPPPPTWESRLASDISDSYSSQLVFDERTSVLSNLRSDNPRTPERGQRNRHTSVPLLRPGYSDVGPLRTTVSSRRSSVSSSMYDI